jgi:hypothetical protein
MAVAARVCFGLVLSVLLASPLSAQAPPAAGPPAQAGAAARPDAGALVKVFIDCVNASCDTDFFRTEISFVDHVRDRKDAEVHVLITAEETGGGGQKYTLNFIGLQRFAGIDHLLHYVSRAAATPDELRRGLANTIEMGLVHYVADTPVASQLQITHVKPAGGASGAPARDPWDYWYMQSSVSVYTSGEKLTNSTEIYGSVGASRVTDQLKISIAATGDYGRSRYTLTDGSDLSSTSRTLGLNGLVAASLSPRWSAGLRASATRSTYYNEKLALYVMPAIEVDLYPYSESTRRQLTFNYAVGARHFRYDAETIFDRTAETRPVHSFLTSATFKQPWGSFYSSFEATQYLDDRSKNRLIEYNSLNVRLFKGFSVRLYGDIERIHDQFYLAKGNASIDEILLRRRQLATSYSYFLSFGLSYSFGSIHNNIVNTRFSSSY